LFTAPFHISIKPHCREKCSDNFARNSESLVATGRSAACQSGAKAAAVQMLRAKRLSPNLAQRLDCVRFTAAF
jgi:hypothetical protein